MWQNGPVFLWQPVEEWPHKSAKEVTAYAKEGTNKLYLLVYFKQSV